MDHLKVLKEKVASLRAEIAHISKLNEQYRRRESKETMAQVAHGKRHERLLGIQEELIRLADLGLGDHAANQILEHDHSRLQRIKHPRAS